MKKAAFLAVFILFCFVGIAQKSPKIDFAAPDNTIDYGKTDKNSDNGIRTFEFTNTGTAPLVISSVQSTSGITILSKPDIEILPGNSSKIEIKYNMNPGPIRKTITVETNATNYPDGRVALKIKGEVTN